MSELRAIGIWALLTMSATAFAQTSDTTPPELIAFDFNPKNIDVTGMAQIVTATAEVTDDLSGPSSVCVTFRSPSGAQNHGRCLSRTELTPLHSTFTGPVEIPEFVESGTWSVSVFVNDPC